MNTGDDENDLSFRLDGETIAVTTTGRVVGAVTVDDVNDLSLRLGGEIVEDSTFNDVNDISFRLERETVVTGTVDDFSDLSLRLEGEAVETATNRIFKFGDIYTLSTLKELIRFFSLKWKFVSSRSGKYISCSRASRSYKKSLIRKYYSIKCGCDWSIRFKGVDYRKLCFSNPVVIMAV